ncbi:hypothetical protein C4571_02635 [Candidatus Parcubacteria bacterium]|nr:MAG: hypothetical protein C4571_02635 [Candidatus Parcubacteria bacterium]
MYRKTVEDTLVFDIETQNFFTDPGVGWDNFEALKISVVGVYSYDQDKYFCFEEAELGKAAELFSTSNRLVGFSINRYDVPVLNIHFRRLPLEEKPNLWEKTRVDLLEELETVSGQRISLNKLAQANLGVGKDRHGSEATVLYREGKIKELKEYCLNDVKLTKDLYDLYRSKKYFLMPDRRTGEILKINFDAPKGQRQSSREAKGATASLF